MIPVPVAMFALNFYSPLVADQLRTHRKTATIRLGDKSGKYKKGMIVTVLVGVRYGQREKIFDAVIDKVEVKQIKRALAARDRARQPRDPPSGRDVALPRPALQPRGVRGRDGDGDPLLADHRLHVLGARMALVAVAARTAARRARDPARRARRGRALAAPAVALLARAGDRRPERRARVRDRGGRSTTTATVASISSRSASSPPRASWRCTHWRRRRSCSTSPTWAS